jgi:hypothetical protein
MVYSSDTSREIELSGKTCRIKDRIIQVEKTNPIYCIIAGYEVQMYYCSVRRGPGKSGRIISQKKFS